MDNIPDARRGSGVRYTETSRTTRPLRRIERSSELTGVAHQSSQWAACQNFRVRDSPSPPRSRAELEPAPSAKWLPYNGLRSKLRVYKDRASGAGRGVVKTHTAAPAVSTVPMLSTKDKIDPLKLAKRRSQHQTWPTPLNTLLQ
jgi:hypothetical protein